MIQLRESVSSLRAPGRRLTMYIDRLKNPQVQERFRAYITDKLRKWSQTYPVGSHSEDQRRRDEELGIILLDLRESRLAANPKRYVADQFCRVGKLREGITSIRRIDAFACEGAPPISLPSLRCELNSLMRDQQYTKLQSSCHSSPRIKPNCHLPCPISSPSYIQLSRPEETTKLPPL